MRNIKINQKKIYLILFFLILTPLVFLIFSGKEKTSDSVTGIQMGEEAYLKSGSIPDKFPKDFPLPKDSIVDESSVKKENNVVGVSLILTSNLTLHQALDLFESDLIKNGWSYVPVSLQKESATFNFSKKGSQGFAGIVANENKVKIVITIVVK